MKGMHVLLMLVALGAAPPLQAQAVSDSWELKGLKLGMTAEEAKPKFPASVCEQLAPGVELCVDKTATLAGAPAHLVTKYLDGRLISVTLNHISRQQAASAAQGLIAKFGDATQTTVKWKYVEADDKYQNITYHQWRDGNIILFVDPLDLYLPKKRVQYSAVKLTDLTKHDGVWLQRASNPGAAAATDL